MQPELQAIVDAIRQTRAEGLLTEEEGLAINAEFVDLARAQHQQEVANVSLCGKQCRSTSLRPRSARGGVRRRQRVPSRLPVSCRVGGQR